MVDVVCWVPGVRIIKSLRMYEHLHVLPYLFCSFRSYIKAFDPFVIDFIKQGYSPILLYVDIQVSLHHWWRGSFLQYILVSFYNIRWAHMWECVSSFFSCSSIRILVSFNILLKYHWNFNGHYMKYVDNIQ